MDCAKGLTLSVEVDGRTLQLHTDTPDKLEFVSSAAAVKDSIACGTIPKLAVDILYRPTSPGATTGEPLRVEFIEN